MHERLTRDLKSLEEIFSRYGTVLVLRRLLLDLRAAPGLLDYLEDEIERLHARYASERDAFEGVLARAARVRGASISAPEARQKLDELLLASRREVLVAAAAAFMPEPAPLVRPELPLAARRAELLSRFAPESEEEVVRVRD